MDQGYISESTFKAWMVKKKLQSEILVFFKSLGK